MKRQLKELLRTANLKEEEISLYLLLLKLNKTTIPKLTNLSGFHAMTVYRTLKRLYERGLVETGKLNNKQNYYAPLSLEALIKNIQLKQRKLFRLQNSLKNLDSFLPYIDMTDDFDDQEIEIKEGYENFKSEYLKFPNLCKDEYLHIGNIDNLWEIADLDAECPEERVFIKKRMAKGIYARVVNPYSEAMENLQKRDSMEKRTMKMKEDLPITENYLAMGEKQSTLFINDKKNPRAIIIKQPELLELQKAQFRALWTQKG